jgi:ribosome-associated protein
MNSPPAAAEGQEDPQPPSKTKRKRAMVELQELGEDLVALPADRLRQVELAEDLRLAVDQARGMARQDNARRRQMQYIGRLMRTVDPQPIRAALAAARGDSADETAMLHRTERLRSELLADEKLLFTIASRSPSVDLQQLRSLRRAALAEQAQGKPPRNYRALFRLLRDIEQKTATADREEDDERQ